MGGEKMVVVRFRDGKVVKGYVKDFRIDAETVVLSLLKTREDRHIPIEELKAIFFVKSFEGVSNHVELKAFGIRKLTGRKAFVKFSDRETLVGFVEGDIPWDKGFSLAKLGRNTKGFFLPPVDCDCNNERVFVVGSAIQDITIMVV